MSFPHRSLKCLALLTAVAPAILITGCSMTSTGPATNSFSSAAVLSGSLHGGNQPITGATIVLYEAGTSGYGSQGTKVAQTSSNNDASASFSFTQNAVDTGNPTGIINEGHGSAYSCPTTGDPQMYIIATGGNTTPTGANSDAVFIVAIGDCQNAASKFVDMNEVTTVATVAALQQYFNPNIESLGYPNTTQAATGFANGVATIANLANYSDGSAVTTKAITGNVAGVTVTATAETAKINTIADILASCVNTISNVLTTSSNCQTLFANAVPPASSTITSQPGLTFVSPQDTLQAAYYMLSNPTSGSAANINNLFGLVGSAGAPFQPTITTAPTDWTLGIKYSSSSACATGNFLAAVYHPAVDASGNIWIAGASSSGNLMEIGPTGAPLTCTLSQIGSGSHSVVLDSVGNVWIEGGSGNTNIYRYNPLTATTTTWPITGSAPIFVLAADGNGNIFYTVGTSLYEFAGAANAVSPSAATLIGTVGSTPNFLAVDTTGAVWTTGSTTTGSLFETYPSTASGNTGGYLTVSTNANYTNGYGLAIGLNNAAYVTNSNNGGSAFSNTLSSYTGGATITPGISTPQYTAGLSGGREAAVDGAGNVWGVNSTPAGGNYVTGATTSGLYAIDEFSSTGAAISATGTSTTTAINGGFQKDLTVLPAAGRGIAVDPTGNVWVGLNSAGAASTSITELVGAAVPVVTPIPAALIAGSTTNNAVSKP